MPLVKVGTRYQISIPKTLAEELALKPGDYVEVDRQGKKLVLIPKVVIDREDAWYWSKEWQKKEREADEDIKAGRVKRFKNVEDLIKDLNR